MCSYPIRQPWEDRTSEKSPLKTNDDQKEKENKNMQDQPCFKNIYTHGARQESVVPGKHFSAEKCCARTDNNLYQHFGVQIAI